MPRGSSHHDLLDPRIAKALDEIAQRLHGGETVSEAELQNRYGSLMPLLGERVRDLEAIISTKHSLADAYRLHSQHVNIADVFHASLTGYRVLETIHQGAQGIVLRAFQESTNREVAIKLLLDSPFADERRARRFAREIRIASRLQLPNIVRVFDSGILDGHQYFVMQFVDGIPIDDYALLHELSAKARVALLSKVVRAVSRAHQHGIIHRDLKPFNVLVDQDGEPQILDFGLAKALSTTLDAGDTERVTMAGHVVGTMPYISPEQANGFDVIDVRSDVYALGIVLFELLTGTFPYDLGADRTEARVQIIAAKPKRLREAAELHSATGFPSLAELDDDIQAIVSKALAKAREDRYQSASEFADDLDQYVTGGIVKARIDQRWYLARRLLRQYRAHWVTAAAVLLLLAGAAIATTSMWLQARHQRDSARHIANIAQSTLNDVVTNVNEEIEALAGGKAIRKQLLAGVDSRLGELSSFLESGALLDGVSISLLEKQGDVAQTEGRSRDAQDFYLQAATRLANSSASDRAVNLARLYRKAGRLTADNTNYLTRALEYARRADMGGVAGADLELANVLIASARDSFAAGHFAPADRYLHESLAILEGLDQDQLLAEALESDGDIQLKLGNQRGACDSLQRSLSIREQLLDGRPFDVRLKYDSAVAATKLSFLLADRGEFGAAIANARSAVNTSEYLYSIDPQNPAYRLATVSSQLGLTRVLGYSGKIMDAIGTASSVIERCNALASQFGEDAELLQLFGSALQERALLLRAKDSYYKELIDAEACLTVRQQLVRSSPRNIDYLADLASAQEAVGVALQCTLRHQEAYAHLVAAREIQSQLAEQQPSVPDYAISAAFAEVNLAKWHMTLKTADNDAAAQTLLASAGLRINELAATESVVRELPGYQRTALVIEQQQSILSRRLQNLSGE